MAVSILDDKTVIPDNGKLAAVLSDTYFIWDEIVNHVKTAYPCITEEWKHYGKAFGWTFKLLSKKRNMLFLIPLDGHFRARFVLGEKAVACADASDLPIEIKESINAATPYTEGRSIDIEINSIGQLNVIKLLTRIKFDN